MLLIKTDSFDVTHQGMPSKYKNQIRFFTEELSFEKSRLLQTLVKIPVLLSYNTESMLAKVSYLKERLHLEDDDVRLINNAIYRLFSTLEC